MVALAPNESERSGILAALTEARIQFSMHYPCIPDFSGFKEFQTGDLEKSREFAKRAITLPLYPGLSEAQVEEICEVLNR